MKIIIKSELRKLIKKLGSLRKVAKIYGVSYERIRQICVMWDIDRPGWQRIKLVDDEKKGG